MESYVNLGKDSKNSKKYFQNIVTVNKTELRKVGSIWEAKSRAKKSAED